MLLLQIDAAGARTEHSVEWMHAPPLWVSILVILPIVIGAVAWIYRGEQGTLRTWGRVALVGLRAALLLALLAFLAEPLLTSERVQTRSGQIVVQIDDSFSMGIADAHGDETQRERLAEVSGLDIDKNTRRIDLVSGFLANRDIAFIERLRERGNVRVASCSDGTTTLVDLPKIESGAGGASPSTLDEIPLRGRVSRIGDSIYEAVNELRGETISALILFSDGQDNGGALRPDEAARRLEKRGIPIYAVGIGNSAEAKDVRIFGLEMPEVVLEGDAVAVDFGLYSEGYAGERVTVSLELLDESGRPVDRAISKQVLLEESERVQDARIEFVPRSSGRFVAKLSVELLEGELFDENNVAEKMITVLSQKIKVLYIEGPPRYEYRYLKNALTLDPAMEAQCLLLSADPSFVQDSSRGVVPIGAFPRDPVDLFQYHLIIIGDVPREHPLLPADWMETVVKFVDEIGGGVVFIAGRDMPHRYADSPFARLFPVELEDLPVSNFDLGTIQKESFARRTIEGREHPILQFTGDGERDSILWREVPGREHRALPGFFWYYRSKQLKRGGVGLAVHSDPQEDHIKYGPRPLFAFQFLGRGRVFMSMIDSTWRWRKNVGNQYFYRFWGQVIRFTSEGRLLGKTQRFSVSTDQREYTLGAAVRIRARVLDKEFKPISEENTTIYHQLPNSTERQTLTAVQVPASKAYFEVSLEARELGEHRLVLEDLGQEVASASYRVVVPQLEYEEPRMNEPLLRQIAQVTGGAYHPLGDADRLLDQIQVLEIPIPISSEQHSLWDRWAFLVLFVAIATMEWVLRKVFRLA